MICCVEYTPLLSDRRGLGHRTCVCSLALRGERAPGHAILLRRPIRPLNACGQLLINRPTVVFVTYLRLRLGLAAISTRILSVLGAWHPGRNVIVEDLVGLDTFDGGLSCEWHGGFALW